MGAKNTPPIPLLIFSKVNIFGLKIGGLTNVQEYLKIIYENEAHDKCSTLRTNLQFFFRRKSNIFEFHRLWRINVFSVFGVWAWNQKAATGIKK